MRESKKLFTVQYANLLDFCGRWNTCTQGRSVAPSPSKKLRSSTQTFELLHLFESLELELLVVGDKPS